MSFSYIYYVEDPYHMLGRRVRRGGRETMNEREEEGEGNWG